MDADPHKLAEMWRADMGHARRETLAGTARERVHRRTGNDLLAVGDPLVLYDVLVGVCGVGDEKPPGRAAWAELDRKCEMLLGWKPKGERA